MASKWTPSALALTTGSCDRAVSATLKEMLGGISLCDVTDVTVRPLGLPLAWVAVITNTAAATRLMTSRNSARTDGGSSRRSIGLLCHGGPDRLSAALDEVLQTMQVPLELPFRQACHGFPGPAPEGDLDTHLCAAPR